MATVRVGDIVTVPGDMHGIVKFIGPVAGKKGTFAGVQLAPEYAARGKNSGEVDGRYYFKTTIPGSGIFLPLEKAIKRPGAHTPLGVRPSPGPGTPTRLSSFNQGGRTPGLAKPNFSQSVGSGMRSGAASPALKPPIRRESLPRPASPLRKGNASGAKTLTTPKTRPSIGLAKSTVGVPNQYRPSPGPKPGNKFSQSLRQTSTMAVTSQSSFSPLGPEPIFDELSEDGGVDATPTPAPNVNRSMYLDGEGHDEEVRRLKGTVEDRERELREQANSIAEMERSLVELQKLVPGLAEDGRLAGAADDEDLPRDVVSLRSALREKNERIKLLTAEFDANRADFRSTIDTLEMASSETERVYEKRVDELLEEIRSLQDRSEDVESVAQQLKQLEELVQELEEGLEDARRGEAEARGEVEFLRGEVERSRSELRRERERLKTEEQLNGYSAADNGRMDELQSQLNSKDDEIRGLKAIIQNLNEAQNEATKPNGHGPGYARDDSAMTDEFRFSLQQQIRDLEGLLQQKSLHEEELENEVSQLRTSVSLGRFPIPGMAFGMRTGMGGHSRNNSADLRTKHESAGTTGSQRTVVRGSHERKDSRQEWHDATSRSGSPVRNELELDEKRSDDGVTDISGSSAALWCEICEEGGHDILTCSNMFGHGNTNGNGSARSGRDVEREELRRIDEADRPAPLLSRKPTHEDVTTPQAEKKAPVTPVEGVGDQAGMLAGKHSGVINPEKWCALCERDGHESVDCPLEDAF